ncbi:MAG TPA: CYTH domain-containing protein [Actinomycetota bacterium]|nr:CYTH domain-containing protein [Actinomycetota bacterium]
MKEASNDIEREWKFDCAPKDVEILSALRSLLPSGWRLVRGGDRGILDIYFDTPDGLLYYDGGSLRLRKRRVNRGWSVNFKPRPLEEQRFLARPQMITSVTIDEALLFAYGRVPGLAYASACEYVTDLQGRQGNAPRPPLVPVVHLISYRREYSLRPGDINDRSSNHIIAIVERVICIDVRTLDVRPVIRSGFLDVSAQVDSAEFDNAEIEADGRTTSEADAERTMVELVRVMIERGARQERRNKYQRAVEALEIFSLRSGVV